MARSPGAKTTVGTPVHLPLSEPRLPHPCPPPMPPPPPSQAGYVIGLGDRHSSNILLDRHTAEVVHIDLGIAFEQVGQGSPEQEP